MLLVPDTRFLSESGFAAVKRFLASGRTVITDKGSRLELPGVVKLPFEETAKLSAADREAAWRRGAKLLLQTLAEKKFRRTVSSPSDNLVISRRLGDGDQAIFLINDSRTAGDYVGKFGKVLEAGVPQRVKVELRRSSRRRGGCSTTRRRGARSRWKKGARSSSCRRAADGCSISPRRS
ncbi:MAG: hypothetical protein L6W00_08015 [Lentisphaeria bacterium]|nr:MAG: hypothetical protein L6W00_08015 [Lentisphaeria bacterium]